MRPEDVLQLVHREIALALGNVGHLWGLNEVVGRIYGVLFFADEPLSLDEIAKRMGMSMATVSLNLPVLEGLRTVRRVWRRGDRKRYYSAETDISKIIGEMLRTVLREEVEIISRATGDAFSTLDRLSAQSTGPVRARILRDRARIQALAEYVGVAQKLLEVVAVISADGSEAESASRSVDAENPTSVQLRRRGRRVAEITAVDGAGGGGA